MGDWRIKETPQGDPVTPTLNTLAPDLCAMMWAAPAKVQCWPGAVVWALGRQRLPPIPQTLLRGDAKGLIPAGEERFKPSLPWSLRRPGRWHLKLVPPTLCACVSLCICEQVWVGGCVHAHSPCAILGYCSFSCPSAFSPVPGRATTGPRKVAWLFPGLDSCQ